MIQVKAYQAEMTGFVPVPLNALPPDGQFQNNEMFVGAFNKNS